MNLKPLYAVLAILGLIVPYYFFIGFLMENGFNIPLLMEQRFATDISTFFAVDVIITTIAVLVFVITDGSKNKVSNSWLPALGTLLVGPSFGFPCYLCLREKAWYA